MTRRRDSHKGARACPTCGETVVRQHAVHLQGEVFHAQCVLYRAAEPPRAPEKEQAQSR